MESSCENTLFKLITLVGVLSLAYFSSLIYFFRRGLDSLSAINDSNCCLNKRIVCCISAFSDTFTCNWSCRILLSAVFIFTRYSTSELLR
ncbi:hypothetical protein HanXRQr2_Chr11g0471831 [Helianthus annuus]|uniref:Uncharacterized protein n=1 Tax=Helianthus annuus TaxID=4232 RepID=A0A9K3HLI8_HELAN|nr:hypothetical protein HanXRQr2_Chr11g0471831 [Helianthus annuus]KAJ0873653.1 hypothetical protein HanPSC8_Chr11g0454981 [Helianthus annuus]